MTNLFILLSIIFFEILCDIIDEDEFWSIDCSSPIVKIINNTNQFDDINDLINYKIYFLNNNSLTNPELIRLIGKTLNEQVKLQSKYHIAHNRITDEMINEFISFNAFNAFTNNIKDYTKLIIWNIHTKSIENI